MSFLNKISIFFVAFFLCTTTYANMFFGSTTNTEKTELKTWNKEAEIEKLLTSAQPANKPSIMLENEWKELLCDAMLEKLDHTITGFGTWGLRQSLQPIATKDALVAQQQRVRALVENNELYTKIKEFLTTLKETEDALVAYYNDANILHRDAKGCYYAESLFPSFNKSKLALDLSFTADVAKYGVVALAGMGLISFLGKVHAPNHELIRRMQEHFNAISGYKTDYALAESSWTESVDALSVYEEEWKKLSAPIQQESLLASVKNGILSPILSHMPFVWRFKDTVLRKAMKQHPNNYENSSQNSLGDLVLLYQEGFGYPKLFAWLANVGRIAMQDFHLMLYGKILYGQLKSVFTVPADLKIEMIKIARFFNALEQITKIAGDYEQLKDFSAITHINQLFDTTDATLSESLHALVRELREVGDDAQSVVYSRGRILLLHKLLQELKNDLIPFLQDIADIDALLSVATVYKEGTVEHPWSYPTFVDSKRPIIDATSFWLPLVYTDHVVLNSIKMGDVAQGKVILTGPNGGGKSTIMKAMAYQIIFAQSWGIVPASDVHISIFTALRTALNPQEDIKRGLSTFMAQKSRMDQISAFIKSATAQDLFFVLVDEPYRGTVEIESQKRVMGFANDIALYDQVMLMMATHFEKPTLLAETLPAYYTNYQCEFIKTADGLLDRTYRLLPGAALWWFHDEVMRGLYIDCLECAGQVA